MGIGTSLTFRPCEAIFGIVFSPAPHLQKERTDAGIHVPGPVPAGEGHDEVPPPHQGVRLHREVRRQGDPQGRSRGARVPRPPGAARRLLPASSRAPRAGGGDPCRSRGVPERPRRDDRAAAERGSGGELHPPPVPGHRHRDDRREEGAAGVDRRPGRGVPLEGRPQDVHGREHAVLADGAAHDVRRGELRDQPPRPDRPVRDAGGRVQVPLRHEGGRFREQDVPLPGNEGAAQPRLPREVPRGEDEDARDRRVPAVSPRVRRRRHLRRGVPEDGETRLHEVPRSPAHFREQGGAGVPRRRDGRKTPQGGAEVRIRGAVRREIFRPRRPGHPPAAPRRLLPGRDGRLLLGRPEREGEDHEGRDLARGARTEPGPPDPGEVPREARARRREDRT